MTDLDAIVRAVLDELGKAGAPAPPEAVKAATGAGGAALQEGSYRLDLSDLATDEARAVAGVPNPSAPESLAELMGSTTARIAVGRAGPRPRTRSLLLFQADHGVAQDAIHGTVPEELRASLGLFSVTTQARDIEEYLLRPDLGRLLTDEAKATIRERCSPAPQVQIVAATGLSAAAINHNLPQLLPVVQQGLTDAGVRLGTPFFIDFARVGVINDVGATLDADVVLILLGERPGLGIPDAMSAYLGWRPRPGKTDAHRELLCMITERGGINPLEAGAYVVDLVRSTLTAQASGVDRSGDET